MRAQFTAYQTHLRRLNYPTRANPILRTLGNVGSFSHKPNWNVRAFVQMANDERMLRSGRRMNLHRDV